MSTIALHGFGTTRTATRRSARSSASERVSVRPPVQSSLRPPAQSSLRLTRRGRLALLVAFVALALAVLTVFGGRSAATGEAGAPAQIRIVEVGEGDTLWGIASALSESGDVRAMIHQIQELNALSGAGLVEGQEIAVPVE